MEDRKLISQDEFDAGAKELLCKFVDAGLFETAIAGTSLFALLSCYLFSDNPNHFEELLRIRVNSHDSEH